MQDINFELYKVFYEVATSRSFTVAAKNLYVSQSAISQSVKTLEEKLGQPLFIRTTKSVKLTFAGEILFSHIEPALHLITQGQKRISEENSLKGGQLSIGASDTICRYVLLPYLQKFHKLYPMVSIKVTNQTSLKCVDLLNEGKVDCILTNTPNSRLSGDFHTTKVYTFEDTFVAGNGYKDLKERTLTLKELLDYPILMLDSASTTSEFLHNLFLQNGLQLVPEIELGSNDLLIELAKINLGIAFVPNYCIPAHEDNLFVVKTKTRLPKRHIVAATGSLVPNSPVVEAFLNLLPNAD
ncbi:MAG: LysR family transcriptional regulator [Lachnospiraceae bacterium]|nr:LysR family transcriptional regulator [Lachnospiraceae bacterium]